MAAVGGTQGQYDVVVIGASFAGLSAALWLGRYRRSTLVVDGGDARNCPTQQLHGYLGFDGRAPGELLAAARREVGSYADVKIKEGRVRVDRADTGFWTSIDGESIAARRVILATGVRDRLPDIAGIEEHYGADVFHCPSCDGYEARDRQVVVIGWSEDIAGFALGLLDWAREITVVTDGRTFDGSDKHRAALEEHGITLHEDVAAAFVGERGGLEGLRLQNAGELVCDLAFFSIDTKAVTGLAEECGCELTPEGYVRADADGRTSIPDLYAAGDLVGGPQLVQVATATGTRAGIACARAFHGEETAPRAPAPAPEPPTS
jgi:thioredoxin reductase